MTVVATAVILASEFGPVSSTWHTYATCSHCGAYCVDEGVRRLKVFTSVESNIVYTTRASGDCRHDWHSGIVGGVRLEVGEVLLLRTGRTFGAVILESPEEPSRTTPFRYVFRRDGSGELDPSLPEVASGHGNDHVISFGPFRFRPNLVADGTGTFASYSVEFPLAPHEATSDGDVLIAATGLTSFEPLSADDPRWVYRGNAPDTRYE